MEIDWVVLTATINVHPGVQVELVDPCQRMRQYERSLTQWCAWASIAGSRVAIAENSGADLAHIMRNVTIAPGRQPRLISVTPHPQAAMRGKGSLEAQMIDEAINDISPPQGSILAKCTGRLFVRNLNRALPKAPCAPFLALRGTLDRGYVDSRFLVATSDVWRGDLAGMQADVDDMAGYYLEHVLAARAAQAFRTGVVEVRFDTAPRFIGISGTTGHDYAGLTSTLRHSAMSPIESLLRHIPRSKQY